MCVCVSVLSPVIFKGTENSEAYSGVFHWFYAFRTLRFNEQQPGAKHSFIWSVIREMTFMDEPLTDPSACGKDVCVSGKLFSPARF